MLTEGVLKLPRLNLCFLTVVFPGGFPGLHTFSGKYHFKERGSYFGRSFELKYLSKRCFNRSLVLDLIEGQTQIPTFMFLMFYMQFFFVQLFQDGS